VASVNSSAAYCEVLNDTTLASRDEVYLLSQPRERLPANLGHEHRGCSEGSYTELRLFDWVNAGSLMELASEFEAENRLSQGSHYRPRVEQVSARY
jgi:hypothetical protein